MSEPKPFAPIEILNAARRSVPAVNYALGVAGIAAAAALAVGFVGNGRAAIIILGGTFIAMLLLFLFARLVAEKRSKSIVLAANVVMWSIVIFVCGFLAATATAVTLGRPTAWATWLRNKGPPTASRDFVIGRWRAFQPGDLVMESVIDYRNNGTCSSKLSTIKEERGRYFEPPDCKWQFEKISDTEFKLSVSYPGHPELDGTSEYEIIDHDRVRHIKGLGGDYTAERLK